MGGANGFAHEKDSKLDAAERAEAQSTAIGGVIDARPVCSGEVVWRRVIGKAFLPGERETLIYCHIRWRSQFRWDLRSWHTWRVDGCKYTHQIQTAFWWITMRNMFIIKLTRILSFIEWAS